MTNADSFPADIGSLLAHGLATRGDSVAFVLPEGGTIGYRELFEQVDRIATGLAAPGTSRQRIAIVAPNGMGMSLALLAAACAGVAVPLNPILTTGEFEEYLGIARADALLSGVGGDHAVVQAARKLGLRVYELAQLRDCVGVEADRAARRPVPRPEDLALVMLTSGSTGRPKRVPLTHRNLCTSARDVCRSLSLGSDDRCLGMWEQFHIGGVVDLLLAPLMSGGQIVAGGGFDVSRFFALLAEFRPTWYQGVPATMHELQRAAMQRGYTSEKTSLRFMRCVAAALPEAWRLEIEAIFGVPVVRTFGMTEASPLIASTRLPPTSDHPGSVGFPCGPEVVVLDADAKLLPTGSVGEVAIRGDNVFTGYEDQPELNAESFRDGWFLTGDLGRLDHEGRLFLTGRVKDIINRGGEKISPAEVEEAFLSHEDVLDAAAFANAHASLGEDVGIALVLRPGARADRASLERHVATRLAAFKIPRAWLFLERMPLGSVGKLQRRELARLYRESRSTRSTRSDERAPHDALEAALLEVWRHELDDPRLAVDDDFADSGGDSLSSLRVIVAVERMLGVELPEDVALRCGSVALMAAELRELGLPGVTGGSRSDIAGAAVEGDDLLLAGYADRPVASLLFDPRSDRDLEVVLQALGSLTTPRELLDLLNHRPKLSDRFDCFIRSPRAAYRMTRERIQLARALRAALADAANPLAWERRRISAHAFLYSSPRHDPATTTLVVGFGSRAMRLTTPTHRLLCALDPGRHALLLLRDPFRNHFEDGIPELGESIEAVSDWLRAAPLLRDHREIVALGTSAGAVPALIASLRNAWPRALLCGADDPARHPRLARALDEALDGKSDAGSDVVIAYSAPVARDRRGAEALKARMPKARLQPDERFAHHALLHHLQLRGELPGFLDRHLLGPGHGEGKHS